MTSPDPVREAEAYQRSLLDALGPDDPADAQATTPARIRRLVDDAGADIRTRTEATGLATDRLNSAGLGL